MLALALFSLLLCSVQSAPVPKLRGQVQFAATAPEGSGVVCQFEAVVSASDLPPYFGDPALAKGPFGLPSTSLLGAILAHETFGPYTEAKGGEDLELPQGTPDVDKQAEFGKPSGVWRGRIAWTADSLTAEQCAQIEARWLGKTEQLRVPIENCGSIGPQFLHVTINKWTDDKGPKLDMPAAADPEPVSTAVVCQLEAEVSALDLPPYFGDPALAKGPFGLPSTSLLGAILAHETFGAYIDANSGDDLELPQGTPDVDKQTELGKPKGIWRGRIAWTADSLTAEQCAQIEARWLGKTEQLRVPIENCGSIGPQFLHVTINKWTDDKGPKLSASLVELTM